MFRQFLMTIGPKLVPLLSNLKALIWADGKFRLDRSIVLLCTLILLVISLRYVTPTELEFIIELLDDVSDILGYA